MTGGRAVGDTSPARPTLGLVAAGTFAVLASLLVHGYAWELGSENQPLQIPVIEQRVEPDLFPGDPAVEAFSRFHSVFFPVVAWIAPRVPVEKQFLVLHLITLAAAASAMIAVSRSLSPSPWAATLGALLLLCSPIVRPTPLGRDTMIAHWVTPTTVSFPILLAALALLLRGRMGWAGIVAGLAAHVNLVAAGLFMIVALPVALGETQRWRSGACLVASFGVLALPALLAVPDGALVRGRGTEFVALLRRYYPYHFSLSSQPRGIFLRLAILIGAAAVLRGLPASEGMRRARRMVLAVGAVVVTGSLFVDVYPVAAVAQLHLLRTDRWFVVILIAAAALAVAEAERGTTWRLAGALALIGGLARGAYPLIAWGTIALITGGDGARKRRIALLAAAGAIAIKQGWDPGYRVTVAATALVIAAALAFRAAGRGPRMACIAVIAIALLELATAQGTIGAGRLKIVRPVFAADWREVQDWAARATAKEDRFMTPPELPGFRVYSRRSAVVERKDGAAMLWEPSFGPPWWERLTAVGEVIQSRDASQLTATARRFGADWIVVPKSQSPPELTPVHENPSYKVFAAGP